MSTILADLYLLPNRLTFPLHVHRTTMYYVSVCSHRNTHTQKEHITHSVARTTLTRDITMYTIAIVAMMPNVASANEQAPPRP